MKIVFKKRKKNGGIEDPCEKDVWLLTKIHVTSKNYWMKMIIQVARLYAEINTQRVHTPCGNCRCVYIYLQYYKSTITTKVALPSVTPPCTNYASHFSAIICTFVFHSLSYATLFFFSWKLYCLITFIYLFDLLLLLLCLPCSLLT